MNKIVAVVGMCGSGKTVATELLENSGYQRIYFGEATMEVLKKRGIPRTPETEKQIREELRSSGDMGIYAKIYLPKIKELFKNGNIVIESLYSWSEYKLIKENFGDNFIVLSIVTNKNIRYNRLVKRPIRPFTLQQANERDVSEIENLDKGGPICIADYYITNNNSRHEFIKEVNKFIKSIE